MFPHLETHITRDMCFPAGGAHISRDMCFLGEEQISLGICVYSIHTEIFAPKINEINFIPVRDCWLLISRTVFVTSEKYRPTNHRPRTALCH